MFVLCRPVYNDIIAKCNNSVFELPRFKNLSAPRIKKKTPQYHLNIPWLYCKRLKEKGHEMKIYLSSDISNSGKIKTKNGF